MERRTFTFVILSLIILYGWAWLFPPEMPPEVAPVDGPVAAAPSSGPALADPAAGTPAVTQPRTTRAWHGCTADAVWTDAGGGVGTMRLLDEVAAFQVDPIYMAALRLDLFDWKPYGEDPGPVSVLTPHASAFAIGAGPLNAPLPRLEAATSAGALAGGIGAVGPLRVQQTLVEAGGEPCTLTLTYRWENTGDQPFTGPLWVAVHDALPNADGMLARYDSYAAAMASVGGSLYTLYGYDDLDGPSDVGDAIDWFGIGDRYFAAYAIPAEPRGRVVQTSRPGPDGQRLDGLHWVAREGLGAGEVHTEQLTLYIGTKDMDTLTAVAPSMTNSVELGWFAFFGMPLLWLMRVFHGWVGNWGVSIFLLTLTVKAVFFPLTQSAFRSGQAMQAIQPRLKEIRDVYADDPAEMNRLTIELFRENRVNPLGGCLPMLLQFPVFIALYNVLLSSVELYQTEFLYIRDLSSADPYCVLPLLTMAVMAVQMSFTPTANMDPMQAKMMKLMPIVFGLFFFVLPSGLMIYMFVNIVLSVLQQGYIKRSFVPPVAQASAT